jgi:hypothetical protein
MPAVRRRSNPIVEINQRSDFKSYRRCLEKRGYGLHKKAMELAIITKADVFLSIRTFDRIAGRNTVLTYTSREDRDWRKHLEKIRDGKFKPKEETPPIRLDLGYHDYERIHVANVPAERVPKMKTRDIKRPWFWKPKTAAILLPQLSLDHTEKSEDVQDTLNVVQTEIAEYFGSDKDTLEDSRVIQEPCGSEEQSDRDATDYNTTFFTTTRPSRSNWMITEVATLKTKRQGWSLLYNLLRTKGQSTFKP